MINDVDHCLRSMIGRDALDGSEVEVVFDAPTKEWSARRNAPVLDLFLYDIREDLSRRENGIIDVHDEEGRIKQRRRPPRYYKLSYLVTAWTQRPEDEHRVLSLVLACFLRYERLPDELLSGQLERCALPVAVTVGLPPTEDRSFADVWSALGGELKPSLDLVVTAPFDTAQVQVAAPPVLEELRLAVIAGEGKEQAGGRRPAGSNAADSATAEDLTTETVVAGTKGRPGRTIHFKTITRK
jgi:hypothetical protein